MARSAEPKWKFKEWIGVQDALKIWHIESTDQTHSRIKPKADIMDWRARLYIEPKYAVAARETK